MSDHNKTTEQEVQAGMHFIDRLFLTHKSKAYPEKVLIKHQGDASRELIKEMKQNGVDQQAYHSGMIVGNHYLTFGEKGSKIMDDSVVAMKLKRQDAKNIDYLTKIAAVLKNSIQVWYKLMLVMKSKKVLDRRKYRSIQRKYN